MKVTISHRLNASLVSKIMVFTKRSRPNLAAVSFDTFVLIQQSTERWMAFACISTVAFDAAFAD